MATKKKQKDFTWRGYVNVHIPAEMIPKCEGYLSTSDQVFMDMNQTIIDGYNFKIRYDDERKQFICLITCYAIDSPNHGYGLSSYADDWFTALAVATYKHLYVTKTDWQDYKPLTTRSFG